jgi:hypothetical protein
MSKKSLGDIRDNLRYDIELLLHENRHESLIMIALVIAVWAVTKLDRLKGWRWRCPPQREEDLPF